MRKILFASSEVHPLIKTGGLADISGSLPIALHKHGHDIRIILPAYRQCLELLGDIDCVATIQLDGFFAPVEILQSILPGSEVPIWLVHSPQYFDRDGGPYCKDEGGDWEDNAARFTLFSKAIAALAMNQAGLDWQPDIVHCNDWQTGLALAFLSEHENRPKTVFTIHNLAYQGLYSKDVFDSLGFSDSFWHSESLEFYDQMSFIKGGLIYADHITTVSTTYADEICSYEFGYGLEGLLAYRREQGRLSGVLNGIDEQEWNPATDPLIAKKFSIKNLANKKVNKSAIQAHFHLPLKDDTLLIGLISRLVPQKGIDLSIEAVNSLLESGQDIQLICLGSGEAEYEQNLRILRAHFPDKVAIHIGYDEKLAHQIEAGADVFLMPSRFEPCGLNQMYSLRYGTLPIVRSTGGLEDSVVDATQENRKSGKANGFKFKQNSVQALEETLYRVIDLYKHPRMWRKMMITAMEKDLSWEKSATKYDALYEKLN